jgi:membrane fusion protein, copper/silver efflux system
VTGNFLLDSESRMRLAAASVPGESAKDPVCGMDVARGKAEAAGRVGRHRGKTYYFCSEDCRAKFSRAPERYVTRSSAGRTDESGHSHHDHR